MMRRKKRDLSKVCIGTICDMGWERTKVRSAVSFTHAGPAFWRIAFPESSDLPTTANIDFAGKPDRTRRRLWSLETMAVFASTIATPKAAILAADSACVASMTAFKTKPTTA
jgi:hypothetical protein